MKRQLWRAQIGEHYCHAYPCCACTNGTLKLVPKSFRFEETAKSKAWHNHADWDPDWIDYVFGAQAECSNIKCRQVYFLTGTGGVEQSYDGEGDFDWGDAYYPKTFLPMPHIIDLPAKLFDDVKLELVKSFETFWRNPEASANSMRNALDNLMTNLGISSTEDGGSEINLHQKIELFSKNDPDLGSKLMSVKWLCNTGSHGRRVTQEELLDAYEILEFCLEEIVEEKSKRIAKLAEKLDARHDKSKKKSLNT